MVLMLLPTSEIPETQLFPMADKVLHFWAFGLVSVAMIFDFARYLQSLELWYILLVGFILICLGIISEYLQAQMGQGRSADFFDVVADAFGVFILPMLLWSVIKRCVSHYVLDVRCWNMRNTELKYIKQLYFNSFLENERRPWADFVKRVSDRLNIMQLLVLYSKNKPVGFITWWRIDENLRFIEHFCVTTNLRGAGIGYNAIRRFIESEDSTVVLEVEPKDFDEMACRRIRFYNRCGFVSHEEFQYIQPAYSENLESVKMMLMTTEKEIDLHYVKNLLYSKVYGVK